MTAVLDPEAQCQCGAAERAAKTPKAAYQHSRALHAAAALALTVLLAFVADRLSCPCGGGATLGLGWLGFQRRAGGAPCKSRDAPNFILFSLDGGAMEWPWEVAYNLTLVHSGAKNPNGCRMPMTWFTSCCHGGRSTGECDIAQKAYRAGHELASHTMTHPDKRWMDLSFDEYANEIGGQRAWLVKNCSIPAEAVVGFRAPGFRTNEPVGKVLVELGFKYDSSHPAASHTQRAGALDRGFRLTNARNDVPHNWTNLPIWEVPAYRLPGGTKRTDPLPAGGMSILERLKADFQRKRGYGVPVPIISHINWLADPSHRAEVVEFLQWAMAQPNTWGVTYAQYISWLEAPPGTNMSTVLASNNYMCERA